MKAECLALSKHIAYLKHPLSKLNPNAKDIDFEAVSLLPQTELNQFILHSWRWLRLFLYRSASTIVYGNDERQNYEFDALLSLRYFQTFTLPTKVSRQCPVVILFFFVNVMFLFYNLW